MAYSEEVIRRARARLAQEKEQCEAESAARIAAIYEAYPRLQEIQRQLRLTMAKAVSHAFAKGEDTRAAMAAIKEENLALQQERSWILEAADLEPSALEPAVVCTHCGGSGYVGAAMCECLQELCRQEQKKELSSLLGGRESFDQFRADHYPDRPDPAFGVSPRQLMQQVFLRCRSYAKTFSRQSPSLLFTGQPGLGKTFLSACIARAVADGGSSVVYETVSRIFSDFESVKFGGLASRHTDKYLQCDLLIMDDLGTEMTTQFTQSVLYQIINTRLMEDKPVIISTNLSDEALKQRYAAAIVSRLMGEYELLQFLGEDIRQLRR